MRYGYHRLYVVPQSQIAELCESLDGARAVIVHIDRETGPDGPRYVVLTNGGTFNPKFIAEARDVETVLA